MTQTNPPYYVAGWSSITPEQVSQHMSFVEGDMEWRYQQDAKGTMAAKQAEGVAYLCRLLSKQGLALLADEVGMGKTFQAIGVIRLLLLEKPDAKVLVIAPNRNICHQWQGEFGNFHDNHWHQKADQTRNAPLLAAPESQLEAMVARVGDAQHNVYFTTIHALSGLVRDSECEHKADVAKQRASELKTQVMEYLDQQGFDLLVIDEAHYLRARAGGSQKVAVAERFFGNPNLSHLHNEPLSAQLALAKRVLLLTATPTHSCANDVYNILSYFAPKAHLSLPGSSGSSVNKDAAELLSEYGLRRLRLLQGQNGQHYAKQNYRRELDNAVSFAANQDAELFFGLYQRQLVRKLNAKGANRQFLYGYLEGFESFGERESEHSSVSQGDEPDREHGKDAFRKALDSELLHSMSQQFHQCLHRYPEHPKYQALVDRFVPATFSAQVLDESKHLVFVRRIPSVRELTKRVNSAYDERLGNHIARALGLTDSQTRDWHHAHWSRAWLNTHYGKHEEPEETDEEPQETEFPHEEDQQLRSRVAELFVVKKKGSASIEETRNTVCTNVGLRFKKPESAFSLFLEPALDFAAQDYRFFFEHDNGGRTRAMYATAASVARAERYGLDVDRAAEDRRQLATMPTIWKHLVEHLPVKQQGKLQQWPCAVKENFANYFKAGVLFASPLMVELFCWYMSFERQTHLHSQGEGALARYREFVSYAAQRLSQSMLLWYFQSALETFEDVCRKIARIGVDDYHNDWRRIKGNSSPAAFASSGSTNRDNLQLGFNSPFYPNVLVATSVFQEGVNLHLQCNQVHHYGLAGSPGDHEQRVGRLDRLFSKVNRQYQQGESAELQIHFPYLEHSFDEDQLASFVERKARAESKLDKCLLDTAESSVGMEKVLHWRDFLKKPQDHSQGVNDPYPARFDD